MSTVRPSTPPTLVAVAHGSPDPRARQTVRTLLRLVGAMRKGLRVELGHLDRDEPLLADTLARLRGDAVLVPLLFSRGHHVKHDIPALVAAARNVSVTTTGSLGPHPLLTDALHSRLMEAGYRRGSAVVLAAAGSRDPESAAGTQYTAQMLSARLGGVPVLPGYASAAQPSVADAIATLRERGHREIAVSSCFVAPGVLATRCAEDAPGLPVARPLGSHPALARLLLHRYDRARGMLGSDGSLAATA